MRPSSSFLDDKWSMLKESVIAIYNQQAVGHTLETLYSAVELICAQKMGEDLYAKLEQTLIAHMQTQAELLAQYPSHTTASSS